MHIGSILVSDFRDNTGQQASGNPTGVVVLPAGGRRIGFVFSIRAGEIPDTKREIQILTRFLRVYVNF